MKNILLLSAACLLTAAMYSCTVYRGIAYGAPSIEGYKIFENDTMHHSDTPWHFEKGRCAKLDTTKWRHTTKDSTVVNCTLDSLFTYGKTTALLIIRNDSTLLERYYKGPQPQDVSTVYSISKTLTCMLAEIATDEGFITSIDDPVRKYFPELGRKRDTMFNHLTIRHLMDMRAALNHPENYGINPFSKLARLFYGRNAMGQLKKLRMTGEPNKEYQYQSGATEVLGVVIERATGRPLAQYMEEKIWKPLGMEHNGLLSLDSKKRRTPKAFGGFAVTAVDLAKIGRLYLNMGNWNGVQILDSAWVREIMQRRMDNNGYNLSWRSWHPGLYTDSTEKSYHFDNVEAARARAMELGKDTTLIEMTRVKSKDKTVNGKIIAYDYTSRSYFALGILEQVMYIDPEKRLILIRLGHKDDFRKYRFVLNDIAEFL